MTAISAASVNAKAEAPPAVDLSGTSNEVLMEQVRERFASGAIDEQAFGFLRDASPIEDIDAFGEARDWLRRGDKREALHYLANALGRDFRDLDDLRPEDLR